MLPDRVSNPGPLTYESDALPIALRGPAHLLVTRYYIYTAGSMTGILEQPKWESLKKRRKNSRLIMLYKGLKRAASIPTDDLIQSQKACKESSFLGISNPNGWY